MALRVGCIGYINTLPLYLPFCRGKIKSDVEFVFATPAKLNSLLRKKQLDAALTSSVEYLDGEYQLLPGFGIAAHQNILSVNLYTQLPVSSLSGMHVGVTPHSATASALLQVLCRHLWKIEPLFKPLDPEKPFSHYAALLLIGDEALENLSLPGFQTIDLGAVWHALTGLPFVFALFAVRREVDGQQIALFQQQLEAALHWSHSNREIVEKEALAQCAISPQLVRQYYAKLQHRLGEKEMEGLEMFKKLRNNSRVPAVSS
jgi:predicted solute-binding protein